MKNQCCRKLLLRICSISGKKAFLLPIVHCRTEVLHPKKFTAFLSEHIAFELCYTCATLLLHPTGKVSKTDFALYKDSNGMLGCGEAWLHCEVDGRLWTLLSVWKLESYCSNTCSAIWTKTESNMLLDSQNILCPLTWQKHGPQKIVTLIPMPFRP